MEFFSTFTAWTSHKLYFRLHSDPGMNVIRRRPQPKTSTHALKGICFHNQRHLPPQHKAFASKIHALNGIFQPRPGVTWRFFSTFYSMITPNIFTHALKCICTRNQRHLPSQHKAFASKIHALTGICPPRPAVTWRSFPTFYSMITPATCTHTLKDMCPHKQRRLSPQRTAFASKIHALKGICPPRPAGVT